MIEEKKEKKKRCVLDAISVFAVSVQSSNTTAENRNAKFSTQDTEAVKALQTLKYGNFLLFDQISPYNEKLSKKTMSRTFYDFSRIFLKKFHLQLSGILSCFSNNNKAPTLQSWVTDVAFLSTFQYKAPLDGK